MNRLAKILLLLTSFCLLGTAPGGSGLQKRYFQIEDGSRLYLKGTSNVNAFTCDCEDRHAGRTLDSEVNGGHARFRNAELVMRSGNFNCHNRKIDADMQKALKADQYPHIKVALVEAWQDAKCLNGGCKGWFDVQAKVQVTITKVTREEYIPAQARILGPNRYQIRGEKALQMSAFGINPPEALFGMIKVNDWITFHFDLVVRTDEPQ